MSAPFEDHGDSDSNSGWTKWIGEFPDRLLMRWRYNEALQSIFRCAMDSFFAAGMLNACPILPRLREYICHILPSYTAPLSVNLNPRHVYYCLEDGLGKKLSLLF